LAQQNETSTSTRIVGFDVARAYAILGMYVVNFQAIFGDLGDTSAVGRFMGLFAGNSSSAFVMLAGIGCSMLTWRPAADAVERRRLRSIVVRRSWFLFVVGLLLYTWWPADILHFYGGYMHLAALLLFAPARRLLFAAAACVVAFHALLVVVPYETGWNFDTLVYGDFWSVAGFLRNTFYNGWNPIFPWAAFFFVGMWLGRCDWSSRRFRWRLALISAGVCVATQVLQLLARRGHFSEDATMYVLADYLPPFAVFMASTASTALLVVLACVVIAERFAVSRIVRALAATGQCTLTLYIGHLTLGMVVLGALLSRSYSTATQDGDPTASSWILAYCALTFVLSVLLCVAWKRRFRHGPLEALMRRISG
jgi:uncharacterized membrane protein YeiB